MRNFLMILAVAIMFIACKDTASKEQPKGETPVLALANFDSVAENWVGKEVMVTGIVDHICKHGGKKLFLVDDLGETHVTNDKRFDDALKGESIMVKGIVEEFVIDEAYCSAQEKNFIQKHKEGEDPDSIHTKNMAYIQKLRDSMKTQGVDHFSEYSIKYVSHEIKK